MTFFKKDNNILVDNILSILSEDIFLQLILQRLRVKANLRIFKDKDKDKDFWAIREVYAGSNIEFKIYSFDIFFSNLNLFSLHLDIFTFYVLVTILSIC